MLAQHAQVLGDRGLRDPELGLDGGGEIARGQLTRGEQLQDPPTHRVTQDVERVHTVNIS